MRKALFLSCLCLITLASSARAEFRLEPRTLFDYAQRSWAVGVVTLGKPMTFRDGAVLAFPSTIEDLVWAPKSAKPRNLMFVYEVGKSERDDPYFKQDDQFLAPIRLLPEHSYWKDNLPPTRRHDIFGGRRYAFRGDEIPEVRKILAEYLSAEGKKDKEKGTIEIRAVMSALGSKLPVLREDAAAHLALYPTLQRDFEEASVPMLRAYLAGDTIAGEKSTVIDAFANAKVTAIQPVLVELAKREDATGAAALHGLDLMGAAPPTDQLVASSQSTVPEVRAAAAEAIAKRAGTDEVALKRATELLSDQSPEVVSAAAKGLGQAGGDGVTAALATALESGGAATRPAGAALGRIGTPAATSVLIRTVKEKSGEPAYAAVYGLGTAKDCLECRKTLEEQHEKHADPQVRQLIGVVMAVPMEHKH